MNKLYLLAALAVIVAGGAYIATRPDTSMSQGANAPSDTPAEGAPLVAVTLPDTLSPEAQMGERGFNAVCADCHGMNAQGKMGFGPPLVHKIYEPSHHADMAFQLAVQNGVTAHHWKFGNMPAQEGLTQADVQAITTYVRELQRANGID
jgi:mono/diheme cytochrome c family protein